MISNLISQLQNSTDDAARAWTVVLFPYVALASLYFWQGVAIRNRNARERASIESDDIAIERAAKATEREAAERELVDSYYRAVQDMDDASMDAARITPERVEAARRHRPEMLAALKRGTVASVHFLRPRKTMQERPRSQPVPERSGEVVPIAAAEVRRQFTTVEAEHEFWRAALIHTGRPPEYVDRLLRAHGVAAIREQFVDLAPADVPTAATA